MKKLIPIFLISLAVVLFTMAVCYGQTINACVRNATGTVRVVDADESCLPQETPLSWNVQGPQGPPGPPGEPGSDAEPNDVLVFEISSAEKVVDDVYPSFTEIKTVHIPPGNYLAIARFNVRGTAYNTGSSVGTANDDIYCNFGYDRGNFGSNSFGLLPYGPVTFETYWMSGALVTHVDNLSGTDLTLECAYQSSENLDAGGYVWVEPTIIYAIKVGPFFNQ